MMKPQLFDTPLLDFYAPTWLLCTMKIKIEKKMVSPNSDILPLCSCDLVLSGNLPSVSSNKVTLPRK